MMSVSSLWIFAECLFIRHSPGSQEYQAMVAPLGRRGNRKAAKRQNPPPAAADEGYWLGCFASDYVCRPCGGLEKPSSSFQLEQVRWEVPAPTNPSGGWAAPGATAGGRATAPGRRRGTPRV